MNFVDVYLVVMPVLILRAAIPENDRFVAAVLFYEAMLLVGYMTFRDLDKE